LDSRKQHDEARVEAEQFRRKLKQLEGRINKESTEAVWKNLLKIVQTIDDSHFSRFHTKHGRARYWHVSWQSKHSKPSSNCNKKPVDRAAPTVDDNVADDVVESASGTLHCRAAFLCKIAPILTPEGIALIGNKWHGAHNKTICAVLRVHDARCCAVRHHTPYDITHDITLSFTVCDIIYDIS
jgi:hypothetical protein